MKFRSAKSGICALAALSLTAVGSAQVYNQVSVKKFATLTSWTAGYDEVTDSTVDAAGNRYYVGLKQTGSVVDSYLAKVTKKGFLTYYVPIPNTYAYAVATDTLGNVYVGGSDSLNNTSQLQKFDAASGAMAWSKDSPYGGGISDLAVTAAGVPITSGNGDFGYGYYNAFVAHWDPTGVANPDGWLPTAESYGYSLAIRPSDGLIMLGGYTYDSGTGITNGLFLTMHPDFGFAELQTFTNGQYGEYFNKVVFEPTSGTAIAMGQIYADDGGEGLPVIAACSAVDDGSGNYILTGHNYPFSIYGNNGYATDLEVGPEGNIYFAATNGYSSSVPERANIYTMTVSPFDPSVLYASWYSEVPTTDVGTYDAARGLSVDENGPVLLVQSDLTVGLGSASYQGYQTFSWTPAGAPIDRKIFGVHALTPYINTVPYSYYDGIQTAGGYMSIHAITSAPQGLLYTTKLEPGPDDVYKVDEDEPLIVGPAKSVLNNDGNQFKFDALSCQVITSSISAGINTLTLNADGTFSANFVANFNGLAKFKYRLKQNGVVIATNQVKINVKPKNDDPTAVADSFNVAMNSAVQNLNVLANDFDVDIEEIWIKDKTNNPNATIGLTADKKFITFKPKPGFAGDVTFTYTIKDIHNATSTANVTVHVS